jgi:flagellar basal body-associated protein FliL
MEAELIGPTGRTTLGPAVVTIGRMPGNQLLMTDPQSSSHHAEIRPDGQGYSIVDLGSTNGTFVNEERLPHQTPRLLVSGDRVRIGNTVFTYEVSGAPVISPTVYVGSPNQGSNVPPPFQPTVAVPPPNFAHYNANEQRDYQQPPPPPAYQQQYPAAAPAQYAPPLAPAYPPPALVRKKSRRGLWITLISIFVLLVIACVAVGAVVYANRSTPTRTLTAFCTALKANDYHTAYQQLSVSAQGTKSESDFTTTFQKVGGVKDCTFNNVNENSSTATALVTLTLNLAAIPPIKYDSRLVDENGTWKIDALKAQK